MAQGDINFVYFVPKTEHISKTVLLWMGFSDFLCKNSLGQSNSSPQVSEFFGEMKPFLYIECMY